MNANDPSVPPRPIADPETASITPAQLPTPRKWELLGLVPIVAGLCWLLPGEGLAWLLWSLLPGVVLLGCGVGLLMFPGDPRICAYMAVAALFGVLFYIPAWITGGFGAATLALAGSLASFMTAGRASVKNEPLYHGVPVPQQNWRMDLKVGLDQLILGYFVGSAQIPTGDEAHAMFTDVERMLDVFQRRGWDVDPGAMHPEPPPPERVQIERTRFRRHDYEILRFDSGYAPDEALPGAALWRSYVPNNTCHVRMFRHPGPPRPWLLCVHGYRMGLPALDLSLFDPEWLHRRLGLNILQPVLPLHGPRRIGPRTGDHFLDGNPLDLVYAESQTLWDLRRTLAWLRQSEGEGVRVGVLGYSLGGYNTALLATYERRIDFAATMIPVVDFSDALMRLLSPAHLRFYRQHKLDGRRYQEILRVVSPLSRPALLAPEHRHIVAGVADQIVLPEHPLALSRHWNVPVNWYQGSHLSVRAEEPVRTTLQQAMTQAGWAV